MEAQLNRKQLSCIPCAKRKVRCDRLEPCSHCRRRKGDICEYPLTNGSPPKTRPSDNLLKTQQDRIAKLEQYILESGGDPDLPYQVPTVGFGGRSSPTANSLVMGTHSISTRGTKRSYDDISGTTKTITNTLPPARLVEHNKQTSYIDAPMWYTWNEASKPDNELFEVQQQSNSFQQPQINVATGYSTTLLDPPNKGAEVDLYLQHRSKEVVHELWNTYIKNVHPLVKIFFDWDKAPLIHKAADDPASLSQGQQALVFAIYFIATLSLSNEECQLMFNFPQSSLLNDFQSSVETALVAAKYAETSDLIVLQAFTLYLLAMRNRAKPATSFSLLGMAVRIGQRLGLHRDGSLLGLSAMQAEERRRTWWHFQYMEISIGQLTGCLSVTLFADWDAKLPANLEDDDIYPEMEALPPDRHGLTSMSHCLWRYYVLQLQRGRRSPDQDNRLLASSQAPLNEKDAMTERFRVKLAEKFLQHCELVNPLHVQIQIGIQNFLLAMQRGTRQGVSSSKISEMSSNDRDEFLKICIKCMDYYIYGETTPLIFHFRWHNENYFQWTAFVYILIEAHYQAAKPKASSLWMLIDKVCKLHPKLTTATERPEVSTIGRLILRAWQQRQEYLQEQQKDTEKPWCVVELERALSVSQLDINANGQSLSAGFDTLASFDFDLIDWSSLELNTFSG